MPNQHTTKHYDNSAETYENQWKGYLENTHSKLLEALIPDIEEDDVILDVSCGTGLLARKLLEHDLPFRELVLNDISPRMLGLAQNRLSDDSRISYTSYPADDLKFGENQFTKVICLNAFHHYLNPSIAAGQFRKVLTPHGRLYLLDWNRSGWFRFVNTLISLTGKEIIHTLHINEVIQLLEDHHYHIDYSDTWRYKYWKLYLVVGGFQPWRKFHLS